jgi:hypothetical protein
MTEFYWHVHHDVICEEIIEPIKNRIKYIKENKAENEINKTFSKILDEIDKLHSESKIIQRDLLLEAEN